MPLNVVAAHPKKQNSRRNAYRHKKRPQILYICNKEITVLNAPPVRVYVTE